MKLPNPDKLVIERGKIADYLLNPAHPDNGGKAEFFGKLGFRRKEWEILAAAFRGLAQPDDGGKAEFFGKVGRRGKEWLRLAAAFRVWPQTAEVTSHAESLHGRKY